MLQREALYPVLRFGMKMEKMANGNGNYSCQSGKTKGNLLGQENLKAQNGRQRMVVW